MSVCRLYVCETTGAIASKYNINNYLLMIDIGKPSITLAIYLSGSDTFRNSLKYRYSVKNIKQIWMVSELIVYNCCEDQINKVEYVGVNMTLLG